MGYRREMLCECAIFQPTAAVIVSRQTMLVGGASTTKCAVVLQHLVLMKQTGIRYRNKKNYACTLHYLCMYIYNCHGRILLHIQLNGTNTTYLNVCPFLEPSTSTPTGDYVQPVRVTRDLELQTRNLPAPVSFNIG